MSEYEPITDASRQRLEKLQADIMASVKYMNLNGISINPDSIAAVRFDVLIDTLYPPESEARILFEISVAERVHAEVSRAESQVRMQKLSGKGPQRPGDEGKLFVPGH